MTDPLAREVDAVDAVDELDELLREDLQDPAFRAAFEDAEARVALLRACTSRRKEKRLSQSAVASVMGTVQSAISELEGGGSDPRLSTLQRYARAVDCRLVVELHSCDGGRRPEWNLTRYAAAAVGSQLDPAVLGNGWSGDIKLVEELDDLVRYYRTPRTSGATFVTWSMGGSDSMIEWPAHIAITSGEAQEAVTS